MDNYVYSIHDELGVRSVSTILWWIYPLPVKKNKISITWKVIILFIRPAYEVLNFWVAATRHLHTKHEFGIKIMKWPAKIQALGALKRTFKQANFQSFVPKMLNTNNFGNDYQQERWSTLKNYNWSSLHVAEKSQMIHTNLGTGHIVPQIWKQVPTLKCVWTLPWHTFPWSPWPPQWSALTCLVDTQVPCPSLWFHTWHLYGNHPVKHIFKL